MNNYNYLSSELCKLGLKKNESDVYLVLLELGYCSVQKIAEKVELSRPTVYRVLRTLEKKKLINTTQKGKRSYFIAGSPDTFLNMLRIKKRQAEEQEREFLRIINVLQNQYSFSSAENIIETYYTKEKALVLEKLASTQKNTIKMIVAKPDSALDKAALKIKKRLGSDFKIRKISLQKETSSQESFVEFKKIKDSSISKNQNIIIADRIFIFGDKKISLIKQKNVVDSYNLMFDLIWGRD